MPLLDELRERINARATDLRAEAPCLVHTDANFHNLILGDDRSDAHRLGLPRGALPLEELEALEEQAYLNRISELSERLLRRLRTASVAPAAAPAPHHRLSGRLRLDRVVQSGC